MLTLLGRRRSLQNEAPPFLNEVKESEEEDDLKFEEGKLVIGSKEAQINFLRLLKKCEKLAKTWQPQENISTHTLSISPSNEAERVIRLSKFLAVLQGQLLTLADSFPDKKREEYEGKLNFLQDIIRQEAIALPSGNNLKHSHNRKPFGVWSPQQYKENSRKGSESVKDINNQKEKNDEKKSVEDLELQLALELGLGEDWFTEFEDERKEKKKEAQNL